MQIDGADNLGAAFTHGERPRAIPVRRLAELRDELAAYGQSEELNDFQRYILREKYEFGVPAAPFEIRSLILVATPHPPYAPVELTWGGRTIQTRSLVMSDFARTERDLRARLEPQGVHLIPAGDVPLKRLAVRSGLAVYGRNNVTYVEGMGSQHSMSAFFSDLPGDETAWTEVTMATECAGCRACLNGCPTGAIREDRFLIDNMRCLSYFNESPAEFEFPDWLPASVHHTLYDCLRCQIRCPINIRLHSIPAQTVTFDEAETGLLLAGVPADRMPEPTARKARFLGLDKWGDGVPRNIRVLFDQAQAG